MEGSKSRLVLVFVQFVSRYLDNLMVTESIFTCKHLLVVAFCRAVYI